LREGERMPSLATTNVEHVCARLQMESLYELVEQLRPARAQARIEDGLEFGLDAREGVVGLLEREGLSVVHRPHRRLARLPLRTDLRPRSQRSSLRRNLKRSRRP